MISSEDCTYFSSFLAVRMNSKLNCEVLQESTAFEVRWALAGDSIVMQLVAKLDTREYMSFGISGEDTTSSMINGDVAVVWIDRETLRGYAEDYYLRDKSQCSGPSGSCPDNRFRENTNNIKMLNAATVNGYSIVTYQRPLKSQDEFDKTIYTNQTIPIIWAIGPLNQRNEVSFHSEYLKKDKFIHFGRTPQWNCPAPEVEQPPMKPVPSSQEVAQQDTSSTIPPRSRNSERRRGQTRGGSNAEAITSESERISSRTKQQTSRRGQTKLADRANTEEEYVAENVRKVPTPAPVSKRNAWTIPPIQCYEPEDGVFYAQMGPTGGKRGYPAITGHVGWGISWYINGLLIPEINVVRGKTYTFVIEGGLDSNVPAKYHPFYITDDPVGGYEHQSPQERENIRIFAGARRAKDGSIYPTGTGRLCHWTQKGDLEADDFASFGAYQRTLELKCDQGEPGVIQWTPDSKTPDTVYYQCFTHRYLGWKINVLDSCDEQPAASEVKIVSVPSSFNEETLDELDKSASLRVEKTVKPNSISKGDMEDKVAYPVSAVEDALIEFPEKESKTLPNESPYINGQRFYFNPNPFLVNNVPNYNQNPFYNQNPYFDPYMMQNFFYNPQLPTFRPSQLIHTGLEISSPDTNSTTTTLSTTTSTTTSATTTTTSTTTPLPITTNTLVSSTTKKEPKEHLTAASSNTIPKTVKIPAIKSNKSKHRPTIRTNYIKVPVTSNKKKPVRHLATLVRPSHQAFNSIKPHHSIMHSASFLQPMKLPFNPNNKPYRIRPNSRPNINSPLMVMKKEHPNMHLTQRPSSIVILTKQVQLVTNSPLSSTSPKPLDNNLSSVQNNQSKPKNLGERGAFEIIYSHNSASLKPHKDLGFHPENIKIEKGFMPIIERSDMLLSEALQGDGGGTISNSPASKLTKTPMVKKYSKQSKRSNPGYVKIKVKLGRDIKDSENINTDDDLMQAPSNRQIYYLPPDDQNQAPITTISQPSNIDIIPESSDSDTDSAPDIVVTYDGKKVSGASLTAKFADPTARLDPKSLKTSEFIRTRPQSVPFKGELPPLDSSEFFQRPENNVRVTLNRNLDVPFAEPRSGSSNHASTKLTLIRKDANSDGEATKIRPKRSPHHTPEHTAEQANSKNDSCSLFKISVPTILTMAVLEILLLL